jgi:hypothetical protein
MKIMAIMGEQATWMCYICEEPNGDNGDHGCTWAHGCATSVRSQMEIMAIMGEQATWMCYICEEPNGDNGDHG